MNQTHGNVSRSIFQPKGRIRLNATQLGFMQYVEGRRTIRDIAACAQAAGQPQSSAADFEEFGRQLFESLWRLDFLAMALNPNPDR